MTAKRRKSKLNKKTLEQLYGEHSGKLSDKWSSYTVNLTPPAD